MHNYKILEIRLSIVFYSNDLKHLVVEFTLLILYKIKILHLSFKFDIYL